MPVVALAVRSRCVLRVTADVVVHCRSRVEEAEAVAAQARALGRQSRMLVFDVADRTVAAQVLNADVEAHGAYYGVVCNAGIACDTAFPAMTGEEWDRVVHTNLDGFYNVLQPLVMPMVRRRKPGRIVTLSSVSGLAGNRGQTNYSAAKAGIIGASKALALELASRGITVNCVAPGLIRNRHAEYRRDRTCNEADSRQSPRATGGGGCCGGLPAFVGGGLHHPPGALGQWRHVVMQQARGDYRGRCDQPIGQ